VSAGPTRRRRRLGDLKRLDPLVRRRIVDALDRFVRPSRDIRKLSLSQWRLGVGEWRVCFGFDEERRVIVILRVLPRERAYNR
jgi:mRNA-degrading endonuclease RelE of RelBE toxin-antitoxin system